MPKQMCRSVNSDEAIGASLQPVDIGMGHGRIVHNPVGKGKEELGNHSAGLHEAQVPMRSVASVMQHDSAQLPRAREVIESDRRARAPPDSEIPSVRGYPIMEEFCAVDTLPYCAWRRREDQHVCVMQDADFQSIEYPEGSELDVICPVEDTDEVTKALHCGIPVFSYADMELGQDVTLIDRNGDPVPVRISEILVCYHHDDVLGEGYTPRYNYPHVCRFFIAYVLSYTWESEVMPRALLFSRAVKSHVVLSLTSANPELRVQGWWDGIVKLDDDSKVLAGRMASIGERLVGTDTTESCFSHNGEMVKIAERGVQSLEKVANFVPNTVAASHSILDALSALEGTSPEHLFLSKVESLVAYILSLWKTKDVAGFIATTVLYVKTWWKGPLTIPIEQWIRDLVNSLRALWPQADDDDAKSGFGCFIKTLKDNMRQWKTIQSSKARKHLSDFVSALMMLCGFQEDSIRMMKTNTFGLLQTKIFDMTNSAEGVMDAIFSAVVFFLERGWTAMKHGDPSYIFVNSSDLQDMEEEYYLLESTVSVLNTGRLQDLFEFEPKSGDRIKDFHEYKNRLKKVRDRYQNMITYVRDPVVKSTLLRRVAKLRELSHKVAQIDISSRTRIAPICVVFYGKSGVSKTFLNLLTYNAVMTANNFASGEEYMCTLNEQDPYMTEYTANHNAILLDDWCNERGDRKTNSPLQWIIDIKNNVPKAAIKADLEDKGKHMIMPKYLGVTTNVADLQASYWTNCVDSIFNRIDIRAEVILADEYKEGGKFYNPDPEDIVPDAWTLAVTRWDSSAQLWKNLGTYSIYEFTEMVASWSKKYFSDQTAYVENAGSIFGKRVCKHYLPAIDCPACRSEVIEDQCRGVDDIPGHALDACEEEDGNLVDLVKATWKDYVPPLAAFGISACVLAAGVMIFRAANSANAVVEQSSEEKAPEPMDGENKSFWVASRSSKLRTEALGRSKHSASTTARVLEEIVGAQIAYCSVIYNEDGNEKVRRCNISPLRYNFWLIPLHILPKGSFSMRVVRGDSDTVAFDQSFGKLDSNCWEQIEGTDCAVIVLPMSCRRDFVRFYPNVLAKSKMRMQLNLAYLCRPDMVTNDETRAHMYAFANSVSTFEKFGVHHWTSLGVTNAREVMVPGTSTRYTHMAYAAPFETFNSLCGAVALSESMILGPHLMGGGRQGIIGLLTQKMIGTAINELRSRYEAGDYGVIPLQEEDIDLVKYGVDFGTPELSIQSEDPDVLSPTHPLRWTSEGMANNLTVYGPHSLGTRTFRSQVRTTAISADVADVMQHENKHGPPVNLSKYHGWQENLHELMSGEPVYEIAAMRWAYRESKRHYITVAVNYSHLLHVIPMQVACKGAAGVKGMEALDLSTSAGFPLNKAKKHFVNWTTDEEWTLDGHEIGDQIIQDACRMEAAYKEGKRAMPVFRANLKDEATKKTKTRVRVFAGTELSFMLVCKRYLGCIGRLSQIAWRDMESCIGTNPYCDDWGDILHNILIPGCEQRMIAGDYKMWDKRLWCDLIMRAGGIIEAMLEHAGYDPDDLMVVRGIFSDIAFPLYEWDGVLLSTNASLPSGVFVTVLLSNLCNGILFRYSYYLGYHELFYGTVPPFRENVHLITYGDDNVASVANTCSWFDQQVHARHCKPLGITYTSADKTSELSRFESLERVSFLKRKFVLDRDAGKYLAPIEEDSIFKSLHNCMKSGTSMETLCVGAIDNALREFFHHGREVYERRSGELEIVARRHDLFHKSCMLQYSSVAGFPTFDDLNEALHCTVQEYVPELACQSGEDSVMKLETAVVADRGQETESERPGSQDPSYAMQDRTNDELGTIFSRPLDILTITWSPGIGVSQRFNPHSLFWNNPRNINRLTNFALMRYTLHVKFVLNGNSFYWGRLLCSYTPLSPLSDLEPAILNIKDCTRLTQRPHVFLDPTTSVGGTIIMPFFWQYSNANVPGGQYQEMGEIDVFDINILTHVNGSLDPVTVTVFAWATDVKLSVPTHVEPAALVPQAEDDERDGQGPISRPASAIEKLTGALSGIPVIGRYAMASNMIANVVKRVAISFGYCKPALTNHPAVRYKPELAGNICTTNVGSQAYLLALDSKNEVTIDPSVVGLSATDEMDISHIAGIESYLTTFTMSPSDATGAQLFSVRVAPSVINQLGAGWHLPACAVPCQMFHNWYGEMHIRFQVVCCGMHRARLRVIYDPIEGGNSEMNVHNNMIVDISETKDFTVVVPPCQETPMMRTAAFYSLTEADCFTIGAGTLSSVNWDNGVLSVFVQNTLTTPSSNVDNIFVNVFVSLKKAQFFQPEDDLYQTVLRPQGLEDGQSEQDQTHVMGDTDGDGDPLAVIYAGESVQSFRALLKRMYLHATWSVPAPPAGRSEFIQIDRPAFPLNRGNTGDSVTFRVGPISYTFCNTTLMNFLSWGYVARRGAINWTIMRTNQRAYLSGEYPGNSANQLLMVTRLVGNSFPITSTASMGTYTSISTAADHVSLFFNNCGDGSIITTTGQNPVLEVAVPYYSDARFARTQRLAYSVDDLPGDQRLSLQTTMSMTTNFNEPIYWFVGAGDDFSFHYWIGMPLVYRETVFPAPDP